MKKNTLGPFLLSGLMIGPILGSGAILLPPMVYQQIGAHAIWAWLTIMILGGLFAAAFAQLAIAFPGKEGVSKAVRAAFGPSFGQLASNFIISAVCVGPVAVLATAAIEVVNAFQLPGNMTPVITACLLICCVVLLLRNIKSVGIVSLVSSSLVAIILVLGSILTIAGENPGQNLNGQFDPTTFGQVLLLLFWTIIGWELIGNYSSEVKTPRKTIPLATAISVIAISGIYLLVAWAINCSKIDKPGITDIVYPLLGSLSTMVLSGITVLLCVATYLMIVGAITRLVSSLAKDRRLPSFLERSNKNDCPSNAIFLFGAIHLFIIMLVQIGVLQLNQIIAFANAFFLSNALLCILAAVRLLDSILIKISGGILIIGFATLLYFSSPWVLTLMLLITLFTVWPDKLKKQAIKKPV